MCSVDRWVTFRSNGKTINYEYLWFVFNPSPCKVLCETASSCYGPPGPLRTRACKFPSGCNNELHIQVQLLKVIISVENVHMLRVWFSRWLQVCMSNCRFSCLPWAQSKQERWSQRTTSPRTSSSAQRRTSFTCPSRLISFEHRRKGGFPLEEFDSIFWYLVLV